MNHRQLGRSGLRVSPICLGTMNFGGPTAEAEAVRVVDLCRDAGINFVDTASVYNGGRSEEILGRAIQRDRSRRVLATKVIAGPRTAAQLDDYVRAAAVTLTAEDEAVVDALVPPGHNAVHGFIDPVEPIEGRPER